MFDFKSYKIDLNTLKSITEIDTFKANWSHQKLQPDVLRSLQKIATIESIASSTRIEGSTLTDSEVSALLSNLTVQTFESRDEQEVIGYAEVMEIVMENHAEISFTENYIKQLHQLLLKYSNKDSRHRGEYKKNSNTVAAFDEKGKQVGVVFQTASPFDTPRYMGELLDWFNSTEDEIHPLIRIAVFAVVFLEIHPFEDGNGRLSRILTNLLMIKEGYDYVVYSSLESVIESRKERYYLALRATQKTIRGNDETLWEPWFNFFFSAVEKQIANLKMKIKSEQSDLQKVKEEYANLPSLSEKIMNLFEPASKLTFSQIKTEISDNPNTIKKHLQNLVKSEYLEMHGKGRGVWYALKADSSRS